MSGEIPLSRDASAQNVAESEKCLAPGPVTGKEADMDIPPASRGVEEGRQQDKGTVNAALLPVNEDENGCRSPDQSSTPSTPFTSHKNGTLPKSSQEIIRGTEGEGPKASNQSPTRINVPPHPTGDGTPKDLKITESENTCTKVVEAISSGNTHNQDLAPSDDIGEKKKEDKTKTEKRNIKLKVKKANLRKGKWAAEEEQYTMRIIQHFRTGLLSLPGGHTLRSYLAEKLNCDPMRITKKFSGASCLGKRVYNLCDRLQVSLHDQAMAHAELEALERRFKLRIENGTSLPLPSHITETLRNTRSELDHANFMRASYLFVNHPSNSQNPVNNLHGANRAASEIYGNSNTNLQIAFLQNMAAGQQHQQPQSVPLQTSFQPNSALQNQFQMQNKFQMTQQNSQPVPRNASSAFYNAQLQHGMNPNIVSALLQANGSGQNTQGQMHPQAINSFPQNQKSVAANLPFSGRFGDGDRHGAAPGVSLFSSKNAMEALAARYNSASLQHRHFQHLQEFQGHQSAHQLGEGGKDGCQSRGNSHENLIAESRQQSVPIEKVRTKEEQAEGRMLLGFLQELQSNHQKAAKMSTSAQFVHDSISTAPQLHSANASSDGTATTRESPTLIKKNTLLKRGYDISVKKESDVSVTGFIESVPKHEGLSSSGDSSDDNKGGSSGDDTDKDLSAGPLRKRFRRGGEK